jgi:hypothetical protein
MAARPAGHDVHTDAPVADMNVPAAQLEHDDTPGVPAYWPTAQAMHPVAPTDADGCVT